MNQEQLKALEAYGINIIKVFSDKTPSLHKGELEACYNYSKRFALDELQYRVGDGYAIILGALWKDDKPDYNRWLIGIDVDDSRLAEVLSMLTDTWKVKTKRGVHIMFIVNEDIREHIKDSTSASISVSINEKRVEIYLAKRYFVTYMQGYEEITPFSSIKTITFNELQNLRDRIEKLLAIIDALEPYYKEGYRDKICLALSGYLRKAGYDIEDAKQVIRCITRYFNDEEGSKRIRECVEQTYKQAIDEVASSSIAKEIDENLALSLNRIFKHREESDLLRILETLSMKHTNYEVVIHLLRYELDNNVKEAQFLRDYLFVKERKAHGDENKGRWYKWLGYKWEEANDIELIEDLDRYVNIKIDQLFDALNRELATISNEEEREAVKKRYIKAMHLLSNSIDSGNSKSQLLNALEKSNYFNDFKIFEDQLDNHNDDIIINTLTHLLVYDKSLKIFKAIPHGEETKRYYLTKVMNVRYDPNAKCDRFVEFLKEIMEDDIESVKFLATILGSCLIRRRAEVCYIFHGFGRNGKTTLLEVMKDIMNDYAREANISLITTREEEGKNPEFVASAYKHLVVIDEPTKVKIIGSILKSIISTGKKSARTLNARPQEYEKTFNLIISTNPKPMLDDDTEGTLRKLVIIPFNHPIPYDKLIPDYHKILLEERAGIFNLLLAGLNRFLEATNIYQLIPEKVKRYTNKIIWEKDHIKEFVDRYLVEAVGVNTPFKDIYDKYEEFCRLKNVEPLSKRSLSEGLEKKGFASIIVGRITYKKNCKIRDQPTIDGINTDLDDDGGDNTSSSASSGVTTTSNTITSNNNNNNDINTNDNDSNNNDSNNNNSSNNNSSGNNRNPVEPEPKLELKSLLYNPINVIYKDGSLIHVCSVCNERVVGVSLKEFVWKHRCFRDYVDTTPEVMSKEVFEHTSEHAFGSTEQTTRGTDHTLTTTVTLDEEVKRKMKQMKDDYEIWKVNNLLNNLRKDFYIQEGNKLICRYCNREFIIPEELANDNITIDKAREFFDILTPIAYHGIDHEFTKFNASK